MTIAYFCSYCGAENVSSETLCCACQQPLDISDDTLTTPTLLNERYEVLAEIGSGGFGAVYKARDKQKNNHFVAVKQINLKGLSSQEIIEATDAFNREAQILSTLSHPLLPSIFDRFNDPDHWYLVMNFIDGQTLGHHLQAQAIKALPAHAGLTLAETLAIGLHLCDVLHYLHIQHPPVIFRDLKPGNIMRTTHGHLYLIDFGIARRFKPGQAKDTVPFGSPGFAAPEQYGRAQTTPQADIYSLGALLYCLLSNDDPSEHPFQFPSLPLSNVEGLREMDELIQHMVALEPAQRPATIQKVQATLQHIKHVHANTTKQKPIWIPPQSQTPPDPTTIGSAQQQIFLASSVNKTTARKTTRRTVVTGALATGGVMFLGAIVANTLLRHNYPSSSIDPATTRAQNSAATHATHSRHLAAVPLDGPASWSPDLSHAAVINTNQQQIDLYDARSKQVLQTIKPVADMVMDDFLSSAIQWSPDNDKIVLTSGAGATSIWRIKNKQQLFTLPSESWDTGAIVWSPTGEYMAVESTNSNDFTGRTSRLVLLQASDGRFLSQKSFSNAIPESFEWLTTNNPASFLAWSPDSKYIFFPDMDFSEVSANGTWSATIWQRSTFQAVSKLTIPLPWSLGKTLENDLSLRVSWSPSGRTISIYYGEHLWICSLNRVELTYTIANINHNELNYGPIWSPDENFLAMLLSGYLTILNVATGRIVHSASIYREDPIDMVACAWSADSKSVIAVDRNNIVSHWLIG